MSGEWLINSGLSVDYSTKPLSLCMITVKQVVCVCLCVHHWGRGESSPIFEGLAPRLGGKGVRRACSYRHTSGSVTNMLQT